MSRDVEYPDRPTSEQLVDLHVYVVPPDLWRDHLNSAINTIINDTVSAGFVRVMPESSVYTLREELEQQLGYDIIPRDYVFLKSVGRCLTRIRPKQEFQLKVKNFLPPLAYVPEVFLLEASSEYISSYPSSCAPSGRNSRLDPGPSDFNPHRPVPPIRNSQQGSLRNGTRSVTGTLMGSAGTQTGHSPRSVTSLTDQKMRHSPEVRSTSLPSYNSYKPVDSNSFSTTNSVKHPGWAKGQQQRRLPSYIATRHVNQLTPVLGSEPPGDETARTSPDDRRDPQNNVTHRPTSQSVVNPSPISQVPPGRYPTSYDNTQYGTGSVSGSTDTWATRTAPTDRKITTHNDSDGTVLNSVRSEFDHSSPRNPLFDPPRPFLHPNSSYGSNSSHIAIQTDPSSAHLSTKSHYDPHYGSQRHPSGPSDIMRPVQDGHLHNSNNSNTNTYTKHSGASDMADSMDYNSSSQRHPPQQGSQLQSHNTPRHPHIQYENNSQYGHPQYNSQNSPHTSQPNVPQNASQNGPHQNQLNGPHQNGPYQGQANGPQQGQPNDLAPNGSYHHDRPQYQRKLDEGQGDGYESLLSATPPNSAGHTRVSQKKNSGGQDMSKFNNNTSDDSGISEMDEVDRRRAEERLRSAIREATKEIADSPRDGEGSATEEKNIDRINSAAHLEGWAGSEMPVETTASPTNIDGSRPHDLRDGTQAGDVGSRSPAMTDRRHDLLELERRRQEVLEEEKRKHQEEESRWKDWGGEEGERKHPDSGVGGSQGENGETIQEEEDPLDTLLTETMDQNELKEKLQTELENARLERREIEKRREELVKRARSLQNKTQQRRAQARDQWKKRYFDEKKKTGPLEEQTNKMRTELEALHRKIMSQLETSKGKDGRKGDKPSLQDGTSQSEYYIPRGKRPLDPQSNLKIQATKLQHEIEDLQRRVENVKMKLTSEMKLRNQAETELRALRAELTQKKINMSLSRTKLTSLQGDVTQGMPLTTR